MGVCGEQSHLTCCIATIRAASIGLDKLTNSKAIRGSFGRDGDVLAHRCFPSRLEDGAGFEKRLWMIVEPPAGDDLQSESRQHYAGSTMIYIPTLLDQPVGAAFGVKRGLRSYHRRSPKVASPKSARPQRLRPPSPPLDGDLNPSSRPSGSAACRPSFSCRPGPLSVSCRLDPGGNAAQHAEAEVRALPTSAREKSPVEADLSASIASNLNAPASPAESSHGGPFPAVSISRPSIAKL